MTDQPLEKNVLHANIRNAIVKILKLQLTPGTNNQGGGLTFSSNVEDKDGVEKKLKSLGRHQEESRKEKIVQKDRYYLATNLQYNNQ